MNTDEKAARLTENLNDPAACRAIVMSLRMYLDAVVRRGTPLDRDVLMSDMLNVAEIAYAEDNGTKALIELETMK